jgi:two-component system, NtrC family, response regulator PilR
MSQLALIVDDEPDIRELLQITLQRMQINSHCAESLTNARSLLNKYQFDLCLTDMKLPDGDGVEFVNELQTNFPEIPVAVISAHGSMDSAIQALKYGAFDFLTKPIDLNSLRSVVQSALNIKPKQVSKKPSIIGDSQVIQDLRKTIEKVARSQAPIYISGESGTGKELAAHMIHDFGPRAENPFIPINCGAIPDDLMESEFFGHKKGSFTGAITDKEGLFQAADGGTLFLDEIAELPQHMQVKLLRAIQEKVVRPVGSQKEFRVDVRILSATNCDLSEQVNKGLFRQDLLYRINVIELKIPPLRERVEDILPLIDHVLEKMVKDSDIEKPNLSKEAISLLKSYHFPGNIRELENILERAVTLCSDNLIEKEDIQLSELPQTEIKNDAALDSVLGDIEKQKILEALEKTRWNKTAAAKVLGISFRALRYRLEKLGID